MQNFLRVLYGNKLSSEKEKMNSLDTFKRIDKNILGESESNYIFINNLQAIDTILLSKFKNSKYENILVHSIFSYILPPSSSNLWPIHFFQPILFEHSHSNDHDHTIIPFSQNALNDLDLLSKNGLLSFSINKNYVDEILKYFNSSHANNMNFLDLLNTMDLSMWSNINLIEGKELSMTPIDLGYDSSRYSNESLSRSDRNPLKIKDFTLMQKIVIKALLFSYMPSIRILSTSSSQNIYKSQYFPDLIFVRIPRAPNIDYLPHILEFLHPFSITKSSLQKLTQVMLCLQQKS